MQAGSVGAKPRKKPGCCSAAVNADFRCWCFDAIEGIKKDRTGIVQRVLSALNKPFVVVLNKIDLVPRKDLQAVISNAALNLGLEPDQIVPIVAKDGKNLGKVLLAVAATEPEMVAALGQALPEYRWQLAWQNIVRSASISATIALAPLPVIDFVPLVSRSRSWWSVSPASIITKSPYGAPPSWSRPSDWVSWQDSFRN